MKQTITLRPAVCAAPAEFEEGVDLVLEVNDTSVKLRLPDGRRISVFLVQMDADAHELHLGTKSRNGDFSKLILR